MKSLSDYLINFPHLPGVYFFKNNKGKILYIGKAIDLKARVSQYFQREVELRPKLEPMVSGEATKIDYIKTESEIEALLLESEMIKRYKPLYNQRWKDDKNFIWVEITKKDWPKVLITRNVEPNKSEYFGPFVESSSVKNTLRIVRKIFPYITVGTYPHKLCFWGQLGQCPCFGESNKDYKRDISSLIRFFKGKKKEVIKRLEVEMRKAAKAQDFETAASLRDKVFSLRKVSEMIISSKAESRSAKVDQALTELKIKLNMDKLPHRIECYDISNLFGRDATGSMTVFTGGVPDKNSYRRFKIKRIKEINDYAMMKEMLSRRFLRINDERFGLVPDLIVIDGGKGQLSAVKSVLNNFKLNIEIIGLAKKNEEIFIYNKGKQAGILEGTFRKIILPRDSHALFLLERIRNEAHRFAITHHRALREKRNFDSILEDIDGIGKVTAKKLINRYKTLEKIKNASESNLSDNIGSKLAKIIIKNKAKF
ncbi:excinuclease ABC subunit UvrC [bacterium]|nr:excinuclease ABC subunit UvrC [bacterium]